MAKREFKVSRKYQRKGKKTKFVESKRGSYVSRAELQPILRAPARGNRIDLCGTCIEDTDKTNPLNFHHPRHFRWTWRSDLYLKILFKDSPNQSS